MTSTSPQLAAQTRQAQAEADQVGHPQAVRRGATDRTSSLWERSGGRARRRPAASGHRNRSSS